MPSRVQIVVNSNSDPRGHLEHINTQAESLRLFSHIEGHQINTPVVFIYVIKGGASNDGIDKTVK